MTKIVEFENVYIELPETYVKEEQEEKAERVIEVEKPSIELEEITETQTQEPVEESVEETKTEEVSEETPVQEKDQPVEEEKGKIIIELPVKDKIVENALKDIEEAEKAEKAEKQEDPAVTKQATTKLSFEELQKRLEETQALHL